MRIRYVIDKQKYEEWFKQQNKSLSELSEELNVHASYFSELHKTGLARPVLAKKLKEVIGPDVIIKKIEIFHKPVFRVKENLLKGVDDNEF